MEILAAHGAPSVIPNLGGFEVAKGSKGPFKPGERVPRSGQAEIVGPRGGGTGEERTVVEGEPFPPTPEPGQRFVIVDLTKHKGKK